MNTNLLIDKLKEKVNETENYVESTTTLQKVLLSTAKELNFKIRNYLESDINDKNSFSDSQEKLDIIKTRIENSKQSITNIREKIKKLKTKISV